MNGRGKIIAFEGGDGSGKATQAALLKDKLESLQMPVYSLDFPQYAENQLGGLIRECLDGKRGDFMALDSRVTSTLYAVDRRESLPKLQRALQAGKTVLLDRYTSSNMVHQAAKLEDETERQQLIDWIHKLEHQVLDLPEPDLVIFLNVPAEMRAKLVADRAAIDIAEQHFEHQKSVDQAATLMLQAYTNTCTIDCTKNGEILTRAEIAAKVWEAVCAIIEK